MLPFRPNPIFIRERHRVLNKADLNTASRIHLGADDPHRFFATLVGVSANPTHRMNVRTAQAAFPMVWRVRPDIADHMRTASRAGAKRLGKAVERPLRQPQGLQASVSKADIDGETCPMFFRAGV